MEIITFIILFILASAVVTLVHIAVDIITYDGKPSDETFYRWLEKWLWEINTYL